MQSNPELAMYPEGLKLTQEEDIYLFRFTLTGNYTTAGINRLQTRLNRYLYPIGLMVTWTT